MLNFTFIGNACGIFTASAGTRVLCDPWLVDGAFEGSWCHYPPLRTKPADVLDVDAVYVSHLHPDHFDERHFDFAKDKPIIVLDHGRNFLLKKLQGLGYSNLIVVKDRETVRFNELELTLFAPFVKHAYEEAELGNLIDSALLIRCGSVSAFNANDNNPGRQGDVSASEMIGREFGPIDLAMLPYNAAGPFPSSFENFSEPEKVEKARWVLDRNFALMREEVLAMKPRFVLPFAGAYVLGGRLRHKNAYLGTTTWDEVADWLRAHDVPNVVRMREGDTLDIATGKPDRSYIPIDRADMQAYIDGPIANISYDYDDEPTPDPSKLQSDLKIAADRMRSRIARKPFKASFAVKVNGETVLPGSGGLLDCNLDPRLLRKILDRRSHWNNAEIGCHISIVRTPDHYEPDLHTALQFLHL